MFVRLKLVIRDVVSVVRWVAWGAWWRRPSGVRILLYHTIARIDPRHDRWRMSVPPERFAAHLQWLRQWGYQIVSLADAVEMVRGRRPIPPKTMAITFDDGFCDTWTRACPLLHGQGIPATVFVVPAHLGRATPFPWLEEADRFERPLTWEELAQLGQHPVMAIGSHAWSHRRLSDLSIEEQYHEIEQSKAALEARLGRPVTWFAYPYGSHGSFSAQTIACLQRLGFEAACANVMGLNHQGHSLWTLKRTRIGWDDTRWRFRLKLAGAYDWIDAWPWRRPR